MSRLQSWRLPLVVLVFVCLGVIGFFVFQSWARGQLAEPEILDLSVVRDMQMKSHRVSLQSQEDEPYHYDFFTLLEQPVPVRALPKLDLEQNPALIAKNKHNGNRLTGKFAVQVSSFKNAGDAQTLVRQLNAQGYHAVIVNETVKGQGWYRVRIDGGSKRESAESLQANIEKKTGMKGFVVTL